MATATSRGHQADQGQDRHLRCVRRAAFGHTARRERSRSVPDGDGRYRAGGESEVVEQKQLVLPVWHGVTRDMVYEYSPSLVNVVGLHWEIGEDEVCNRLASVLLADHPQVG